MKRKHNNKTIQYTQSPTNMKVGYTLFACNKPKVHINNVSVSVRKITPIQCYTCTECNSIFDARQKLKKYTREENEGKF